MSTTPTAALEAILNLPPIHLEVKRKAANDAYRLDTIGAWKGGQSNGHASIWKFLEKHPVALMPTDHMVSRFVFEKTYTVVITEREEWSTSGHECFQITDLIIFSDGSVGWIGRRGVLGESDYRTGPTPRKNDYHIPGGYICQFTGSRRMSATKMEGSHHSNLFRQSGGIIGTGWQQHIKPVGVELSSGAAETWPTERNIPDVGAGAL